MFCRLQHATKRSAGVAGAGGRSVRVQEHGRPLLGDILYEAARDSGCSLAVTVEASRPPWIRVHTNTEEEMALFLQLLVTLHAEPYALGSPASALLEPSPPVSPCGCELLFTRTSSCRTALAGHVKRVAVDNTARQSGSLR